MRNLFFKAALALLAAPAAGAQADTAKFTRVHGRIVDFVGHGVVAGATVQLASRTDPAVVFTTESDSTGAFLINNVPRGDYLIGFFHPAIEDLGVRVPPSIVHLTSADATIPLGTPTAAAVLGATCGTVADSSGLVIGRLIDAESETPIANGSVSVSWTDVVIDRGLKQERRVLTAHTTDQGLFGVCSVPTQGQISITATGDSITGGVVETSLDNNRVLRIRLSLSKANTVLASSDTTEAGLLRGTATLRGRVTSDSARVPVANASVTVRGTGVESRTDASGRFALAGLPSGSFTLDVRAIGYTPQSFPVALKSGSDTTTDVVLGSRATVLDAVQIFGKAPATSAFLQRMKRGIGHFVTPGDIEKMFAFDLVDVLRRIPSVRILTSRTGHVVRYRSEMTMGSPNGCAPTIYLNGVRLLPDDDIDVLADPKSITGIELYNPAEAPLQFQGGSCATLVIWAGMAPK